MAWVENKRFTAVCDGPFCSERLDSEGPSLQMVRVDFFKPSGKWYATEAVKWVGYDGQLDKEFKESLLAHLKVPPQLLIMPYLPLPALEKGKYTIRLRGMLAVCLHPFNKHPHPIMLLVGEDW